MQVFEGRYQLWQNSATFGAVAGFIPQTFDDLRSVLTADRTSRETKWYVTERISAEQIDNLLEQEMQGHPVVRRDPIGQLDQTYQLWSSPDGVTYRMTCYDRVLDALSAPRDTEHWYLTQVVLGPSGQ